MHIARPDFLSHRAMALCVVVLLGACTSGADRTIPLAPGSVDAEGNLISHGQTARWLRMADSAAGSGDRQTAISLYQQVLNKDETNNSAWYGLGNLLLDNGNIRGSADAFAQILKTLPGDERASVGYARAMMALGRPEAAAAHIEPLNEADPENLMVLNLLAVIRDLQGDHTSAQAIYRQGLFINPESVMLRNNMALSAALAGEYDGAIELMKPIVDGLSSTRQTRQNYALIQGLAGNYAVAEQVSRIDLDQDSTDNNLAYFAALGSMEPSQARSAVLRPSGSPQSPIDARDQIQRMIFGVSSSGEEMALADTPNASWFVKLGEFANKAEAEANWQELKTANSEELLNLRPLALGDKGPQKLMVGPLSGQSEALQVCISVGVVEADCQAQQF